MTFYTYIPSRILWLIFPVTLGYTALVDRPLFRRAWRGTLVMLLTAAVIGLPLFRYLYTHPDAEARIEQLSRPLTAVTQGNFTPLLENSLASLRLFTLSGDTFWRYNIAGRPFLGPVMGALFYVGVATAVWRVVRSTVDGRRSTVDGRPPTAEFMALVWLAAGMAPVLVTGPRLSTTQAIGMQPVLYLFPALGLIALWQLQIGDWKLRSSVNGRRSFLLPLLLFAATAVTTAGDYFIIWANEPEVRVQYETTLVTALRYLNENGTGAVAISTITPHPFHSPTVAQMTLHNPSVNLRWFDARYSLLLPQASRSQIILPGFTPLAPALAPYFETAVLTQTIPMRPTDQDRPLLIYQVDGQAMAAQWQRQFEANDSVNFGDTAQFLGYDLQTPSVAPGEQVYITTLWRVKRPLTNALLFTHIQGPDGVPIAQADRLDVPGASWQAGDLFIQLHQIAIPAETAVGTYPIAIGLCQQQTPKACPRLSILSGSTPSDIHPITTLQITP